MTRPAILVTGAARRLGKAIAQHFASEGWHVIIHYLGSSDEADALAASLPSADTFACDLADLEQIDEMARKLAGQHDDWRCLINCASVFHLDAADALDPDTFDQAMAVNARAPAYLAQQFLAHSQAEARRVIMVTDQKVANPNPDFFSYSMSKFALAGSVRMLAMHYAARQDRIYGLAPGAILPSHDQSAEEAELSHRLNPLGRIATVEDIAGAAHFLATGSLASGETIFVDSGQHLAAQPRDVMFLARQGGTP